MKEKEEVKIEDIVSTSQKNRQKLEILSKELKNISDLRYMIDPFKKVSADGVIEDAVKYLEDVKNKRSSSKLMFTID